jgi:hypothetical protein
MMTSAPVPRRVRVTALAIGAATTLVRFLAHVGFPNDHFLYLAPAQQMAFGEWPSRDFVDPGTPLMYLVSWAMQRVIAPPQLAEAWLVALAFGCAAALTVLAAWRVSGWTWLALAAAIVEALLFPRSYHYPKVLAYAATFVALLAYVEAPTRRRAVAVACCVMAAFLFRHDHGVFLAAAAIVAAALAPAGEGTATRRMATMALLCGTVGMPYLIYLALTTGILPHVASGLAYSRAEAGRTLLGMPAIAWPQLATADGVRVVAFYAIHAVPLVALVAVFSIHRRHDDLSRLTVARIAPIMVTAFAVNATMLRDPLQARLPDAAVPALLLGTWLLTYAWRGPWRRLAGPAASLAAAAVAVATVMVVGTPVENLDRAGLIEAPFAAFDRIFATADQISRRDGPRTFSSGATQSLLPLVRYVRRCTAESDRLFVAGDMPELYVLTGRSFAGGQPALRGGFFQTDDDQRRLVARLRMQRVPLVVMLTEGDAAGFPIVMAELGARYQPLREFEMQNHAPVRLLRSRTLAPTGVDAELGLPCYR